MHNKRTKLIFLILTLLIVVAMVGMVACSNKTDNEPDEDGEGDNGTTRPPAQQTVKIEEILGDIENGMNNTIEYTDRLYDYHVKSEYEIYTRVENYTLSYEAVYNSTTRDGLYYLHAFDNDHHIDRLTVYYDSSDLYVIAKDEFYVVKDFSKFLLFELFTQAMSIIDLGDLLFSDPVKSLFNVNSASIMSLVFSSENCEKTTVSETRQSIAMRGGDLSITIGTVNARKNKATENIGDTFDAATMHYFGFRLSKLFELDFNAIIIEEILVLFENKMVNDVSVLVDGRMLDNSKYHVKGKYSFDEKVQEIVDAKELPKKHAYVPVSLGKGTYEGTVRFPTLKGREDSDFKVSLDFDLNSSDNTKNQFTLRIYDQLKTDPNYITGERFDNIVEFCSVYYANETFYINTTGMYDYVQTGIALSMMNLPKVFVKDIDLTNLMQLFYTRFLKIMFIVLSPSEREESLISQELYEELLRSINSDVDLQEISLLVTEELIKAIRGDDTDLTIVLDRMLKFEDGTINRFFGGNIFAVMRALITYNFSTKFVTVEMFYEDKVVAEFKMRRTEYKGVILPPDLNELIYAELEIPERITSDYDIELRPYGEQYVDVSGFLGAFIGDCTGINTRYEVGLNEYIRVKGKVSEEYINFNGERKAITRYMLTFSKVIGEGTKDKREVPVMDVAINPANIDEMLIKSYFPMGDYHGSEPLGYRIDRRVVGDELNELAPDGLFSFGSNTAILLNLFIAANENTNVYMEDGYYCVSMTAQEAHGEFGASDPIAELLGIENSSAIVKVSINFRELDLSNIDLLTYTEPYINKIESIVTDSIYSTGSRWKEDATVIIGTHYIKMKLTYDEETITIRTGQTEYFPTAHLFGEDIQYSLTIINEMGTRKISRVNYENNLLVIDPAYSKTLPEKIQVRYDNSDTGEIEFIIDPSKPFSETNITNKGYNMALLDISEPTRFSDKSMMYKVIIGQNSIAQVSFDVYIAVIGREVKPLQDQKGTEEFTVLDGQSVPIIAEYTVDPYTFAMNVREGSSRPNYDLVDDLLATNRTQIEFENLYGYKKVLNPQTQIEEDVPCYYDVQGYNWLVMSDIDMHWTFDTREITWQGGTAFAYGYYGDKEKGHYVPVALRMKITKKQVSHVQVDECEQGTYLIDYLIKATYEVPTTTSANHTVRIFFEDGSSRIVTRTVSQSITDSRFVSEYIYGELAWENIDVVKTKITVNGTGSIFGTEGKMTDSTNASFYVTGAEKVFSAQNVPIRIVIPSRDLSLGDSVSKGMIVRLDEQNDFMPVRGSVDLNKALFSEPENKNDGTIVPTPYEFEPYDVAKVLPDTIWLYVKTSWGQNALSKWQEYPVQWTTTNKAGKELNIIAPNANGKYRLAHPVTEQRDLVVYAKVGDGDNGGIWVTMHVRNMASEIKEWHLYLPDGTEVDQQKAIQIDPYLSYIDRLPDAYRAVLETGAPVTNIDENGVHGGIKWFFVSEIDHPDVKFPIYKDDDPEIANNGDYAELYDSNGYFIFNRVGSGDDILILEMRLVAGGLEGEIGTMTSTMTLNIKVSPRTIKYFDDGEIRSAYMDIFDRGYVDGETYTAVGNIKDGVGVNKGGFLVADIVSAGYLEINYYVEDSQTLLSELLKIKDNGYVGYSGFLLEDADIGQAEVETDRGMMVSDILYAKRVKWNAFGSETFDNAIKALQNRYELRSFTLTGEIDSGKRNKLKIELKITIYEQTLSSVEMIYSDEMTMEGVYKIKNDVNNNGILTIEELSVLTKAGFVAQDGFKKFFGSSTGYTNNTTDDNGFKYLIYFNLDQAFSLSKNIDKTYTSPYEYYEFLFSSLKLTFASGLTTMTSAVLSLGARGEAFFNRSILGTEQSTLHSAGMGSYSFILMEKLSAGSAVDRTLVIIDAQRSTRVTSANTIVENPFDENLKEIYNNDNGYILPSTVEIQYKRLSDEKLYSVKYAVKGWTPDSESASALGTEPIRAISRTRINARDGIQYRFLFEIPDVGGGNFYQAINFTRADATLGAFMGNSRYEMYSIRAEGTEGLISVDNPYSFFFKAGLNDEGKDVYTFNTELIPIELFNLFSKNDAYNSYTVKWMFTKLDFDESVFTLGSTPYEDNKIKIAEYTFGSYYAGGEVVKQTLNLYVTVKPMKFYGIESEGLTILSNGGENGENALLNVIQIDPYKHRDPSGVSGRFTLPTKITVLFNGGTQKYTFKNSVRYKLMGFVDIRFINFNETGHLLVDQGVKDPARADLNLYIPGYSVNGIPLIAQFLERRINTAFIENKEYEIDGTYKYKRDAQGNIIYENSRPVISTYSPVASYKRRIPGILEDDIKYSTLPIIYVDPYNTATYELPTRGRFDFITEPGLFGDYDITGWQYYDEENYTFMDMERTDDPEEARNMPFYTMRRVNANGNGGYNVCYYNPVPNDYNGSQQLIRGYITVGGSSQYFEALLIVLTRKLRVGVSLQGTDYIVNYDFDDPIAAMVKDIPSLIGENAFVNYDMYYKEFKIRSDLEIMKDGIVELQQRYYEFNVAEEDFYSRHGSNSAVLPEILWTDGFDHDGDGINDVDFSTYTTTGFNGKLDGDVYFHPGDLGAKLDFYNKTYDMAYSTLAKSIIWDELFGVIPILNAGSQEAINEQKEIYDKALINETYIIALANLESDDLIQYFGTTLIDDFRGKAEQPEGNYNLSNPEEEREYEEAYRRNIVPLVYENICEEYQAWKGSNMPETGKIEIYRIWQSTIEAYQSSDVTNSSNISANQVLKAERLDALLANDGFGMNDTIYERIEMKKDGLFIEIHADIWQGLYNDVDIYEVTRLEEILDEHRTGLGEKIWYSASWERLMTDFEKFTDLGVHGETATAEVTIPLIVYNGMVAPEIIFNKFNFDTIESGFTVKFKLSYEDIYQAAIDKATIQAAKHETTSNTLDIINRYVDNKTIEAINSIAPKISVEGNIQVIPSMSINGIPFSYEWWYERKDNPATPNYYYGGLWDALYEYSVDEALYYVIQNIPRVESFGDLTRLANDSTLYKAWEDILAIFDYLQGLETYLYGGMADEINKMDEVEKIAYTKYRNIYSVALQLNETFESAIRDTSGINNMNNRQKLILALSTYIVSGVEVVNKGKNLNLNWNTVLENYGETIRSDSDVNALPQHERLAELAVCTRATESDFYAQLAPQLIEAQDGNVQSAMQKLSNSTQTINGAAMMFAYSYGSNGYYISRSTDIASLTKEALDAVFIYYTPVDGVDQKFYDNDVYGILSQTYSAATEAVYRSMYGMLIDGSDEMQAKTAELKAVANTLFDFITGYVVSKTSPYDVMLDNLSSLQNYSLSREYIEDTDEYGKLSTDCLLYYASPADSLVRVQGGNPTRLKVLGEKIVEGVKAIARKYPVLFVGDQGNSEIAVWRKNAEDKAMLQLKRMAVYEGLKSLTSGVDANRMEEWKDKALYDFRVTAVELAFKSLKKGNDYALKAADILSAGFNQNVKAFEQLIKRRLLEKDEAQAICDNYSNKYIEDNFYRKSRDILNALYDEINRNNNPNLLVTTYFGRYIAEEGWKTILSHLDDGYPVVTDSDTEREAFEFLDKKGNELFGEYYYDESLRYGYMQDYLLQAIVAFYDKDASLSQKVIIGEMINYLTGFQMIETPEGDSLLLTIAGYLKNQRTRSPGFGVRLHNELLNRKDMGTQFLVDLYDRYYEIYLNTMLEATEYMIQRRTPEYIETVNFTNYIPVRNNYERITEEITGTLIDWENPSSSDLEETLKNVLRKISVNQTKTMIYKGEVLNGSGSYNTHSLTIKNNMASVASGYAYENMYNFVNSAGEYVYRDELDEVILELAKEFGVTAASYKQIFEILSEDMLGLKVNVVDTAVAQAVRIKLYEAVYNSIRIFELTPDNFIGRIYDFVYGKMGQSGKNFYFNFGENPLPETDEEKREYYFNMVESLRGGIINANSELFTILDSWWEVSGSGVYGALGDVEKEFMNGIYLQCGYQAVLDATELRSIETGPFNEEHKARLKVELRNRIAMLTMIENIYRFLTDINDYVYGRLEEGVMLPGDYFATENESERKAFIIRGILDGNLMLQEHHSLSLARANFKDTVNNLIESETISIINAVGESPNSILNSIGGDFEQYVAYITKAITRNNTSQRASEADKNVFKSYLTIARKYVEFTSIGINKIYNKGLNEDNPIRYYLNEVNKLILGKDLNGQEYIQMNGTHPYSKEELEGMFGLLPMSHYVDNSISDEGERYRLALEKLISERNIEVRFVSEDVYVPTDDGTDRHVIYFDRTEWEEFAKDKDPDKGVAKSDLPNSIVWIGNPYKMDSALPGHAFTADDITFKLGDLIKIEVLFDGMDEVNTIVIDALKPELPLTVHAIGYVDEYNYIDLGRIPIKEYSNAFYQLIYKDTEFIDEEANAFVITIDATSNITAKVRINVKYKDRSIKEIYLENGKYMEYESGSNNKDPKFKFSYFKSLSDEEADKKVRKENVLYIDPIDSTMINSTFDGYLMPTTIGVRCGNDKSIMTFENVVWEFGENGKIPYTLAGTQGYLNDVRLKAYSYIDDEGNERRIEYNYKTKEINMEVYDTKTNLLLSVGKYTLAESASDMVDWNVSLYIKDRTVIQITIPGGVDEDDYVLGENFNGIIDATQKDFRINPYYPEYPTEVKIHLTGGEVIPLHLENAEWKLAEGTALDNIALGVEEDLEFRVRFEYKGYFITVKMLAMDIKIPPVPSFTYYNGGTIYIARGQDTTERQLKENYSVMFFNFGTDDEPNWQKVNVLFSNAAYEIISTRVSENRGILAAMGVATPGAINNNIEFTIKVVDLSAFALLDEEPNRFVQYNYYSVATDNTGTEVYQGQDPPDTLGDYFSLVKNDGSILKFNMKKLDIEYKFELGNERMIIPATYSVDEDNPNVEKRLGFDYNGSRYRTVRVELPMNIFKYNDIPVDPEFNTDETGKRWTWTTINRLSSEYVDAIFWPLGRVMRESDLPTIFDGNGNEVRLRWDLTDLNVNKANVSTPGTITSDDGTFIYGYYLAEGGGLWKSKQLKVYIEKENVTQRMISSIRSDLLSRNFIVNEQAILKVYDGHFFDIEFDNTKLTYIREDGSLQYLPTDRYIVEYLSEKDERQVWRTDGYPLDSGKYYVRIRFDDYNVYIKTDNEWLFSITVNKLTIDLTDIRFGKEDSNGQIEYVYTGEVRKYEVISGLPEIEVDRWFASGEKASLYSKFFIETNDEVKAAAKVYDEIRARVSYGMQAIMDGWYNEVRVAQKLTDPDRIKAFIYNSDYYMQPTAKKVIEIGVKVTFRNDAGNIVSNPVNVGTYYGTVTLDNEDEESISHNYEIFNNIAKTLVVIIRRDENLVYQLEKTNITYTGKAINPRITGLHNSGGTIPAGVKITYTYLFGENEANRLVVVNNSNELTIDGAFTTVNTNIMGIKNVGEYKCSIEIDGGNNFKTGSISSTTINITKANVFIELDDILKAYLDDVEYLENYIKIHTDELPDGKTNLGRNNTNALLADDRLSIFGYLDLYTPVQQHFELGTYYTYIRGLKKSESDVLTYTDITNIDVNIVKNKFVQGDEYRMLMLKNATADGSLYKYGDEYKSILDAFANYNIYVKTMRYSGMSEDEVGASGTYKIDIVTETDSGMDYTNLFIVGNREDLNDPVVKYMMATEDVLERIMGMIKDGDTVMIYLSAINKVYNAVKLSVDATVEICGYYHNETEIDENGNEVKIIGTKIEGLTVEKGSVSLKIVSIEVELNGIGVKLNDNAGAFRFEDSEIICKDKANQNSIGIYVSINYANSIYLKESLIKGLSVGVEVNSSFCAIEIDRSNFEDNYFGVSLAKDSKKTNIRESNFKGHEFGVRSESTDLIVLYCAFTYNRTAISVPFITNEDMRTTNTFDRTNDAGMVETALE